MSQISRDEVAHLARLARLALTDDELDSFAGQLDAILSHVSQIQAVDVTGVDPTDNPLKDVNVIRPDDGRAVPDPGRSAGRGAESGRRPVRRPADPGGGRMSTHEVIRLDAATLGAKIAAKEVSSTEATQACLDQIAATDGPYHAFLHVAEEKALAEAERVDAVVAAGETLPSPLAGVPLALKDVFTTTDMPTTCGSKILEGWRSPYDATVTARLRAAGIPILGKTNMDEFAMGSSTENSAYGPTRNPWNVERVPGGSGGGSAAALAAFQAPLAIGSDTGGSIRQPAALTATVGVKPTYGTVSRYGLIACASSLDQGGPCARTVLDTALLHQVIAGHDPRDSTSVDAAVPDVVGAARAGAAGDLKGVRIGVVKQLRAARATRPACWRRSMPPSSSSLRWAPRSPRSTARTSTTRWPRTT